MPRPASQPGELALIAQIQARTTTRNAGVRVGIGDDCAVLRVPRGHEILVTTDVSLEGRHFRRDWHSPESAGHRCLARGLSDIAAMGGRPLAAFLSLALPTGFDHVWLQRFLAGFSALAARHGVELAGGDTAQAPGDFILADIILTGSVPRGTALRRSQAKPGDLIYVTGQLGGAAAELARLAAGAPCPTAAGPYPQSFPEPRLAAGQTLRKRRLATACMDLSDGLSTDLRHLCVASGVRAELDRIPVAEGATLEQALHGGEDYELLFTTGPRTRMPARVAGVAVTAIGRVVEAAPRKPLITLLNSRGRRVALPPGGWEHFRTVS